MCVTLQLHRNRGAGTNKIYTKFRKLLGDPNWWLPLSVLPEKVVLFGPAPQLNTYTINLCTESIVLKSAVILSSTDSPNVMCGVSYIVQVVSIILL